MVREVVTAIVEEDTATAEQVTEEVLHRKVATLPALETMPHWRPAKLPACEAMPHAPLPGQRELQEPLRHRHRLQQLARSTRQA